MPNVKIFNMAGAEVGAMDLSEEIFGAEINGTILHTAVKTYLSNQRQGTQSTLTRTEVSGGGKKPWKQKGTGRARQGSTRSPQWTHGGVALGPKPRSYRLDMNKKLKKAAMFSALSAKVAEGKFIVVDSIETDAYKTKVMKNMLDALKCETKSLVVLSDKKEFAVKSCANLAGVETSSVIRDDNGKVNMTLNVYEILKADKVVIATDAVKMIEEVYA